VRETIVILPPDVGCEQIAFEPTLALMLAQHFHHPSVGREVVVTRDPLRHPRAFGADGSGDAHPVPATGRTEPKKGQAE